MSDRQTVSVTGQLIGIDASRAARAQHTGTEGYAYHLIRELIPLAQRHGHKLRLYFNQPPPPDIFPAAPGVEILSIPFKRLWTHVRLARELHARPPCVFFTPAHVIPFTYRGPAVATVHDLGFHYFPKAHTRSQTAYLKWSTGHNVRRSCRILADSEATKSDLRTFYGVKSGKISVVYPGVDSELAPVLDAARLADVQQKYGIKGPYLLYLGTLQPRKNLQRLIEAYIQSGVSQQLVLAGKPGWLSEPILRTVAQHKEGDNIRLTGFVDQEDKAALLSGATSLLYPSLYEGFGFPILEAQACGTPVLCAKNSSQPEVAGNAALLAPSRDTGALAAGIRRLAQDEGLRKQLVEKGLKNVQRFSWQRAAEQVMSILEEVCR
ncbi:MAG: glycosyltransferase family 4 protein [Chloroflexota bacterium]